MKCESLSKTFKRKEIIDSWPSWGASNGFTLLGVLFLIVIFSIAIMGATQCWTTIVKREKESELFYRGDQIRNAIESYYLSAKGGEGSYPSSLSTLLKDPRYISLKRHLRKKYKDPMTENGEWGLIIEGKGGIKGVYSKSRGKPIKRSNFPKIYSDFEKAKTYSDWKFVYDKSSSGNNNSPR